MFKGKRVILHDYHGDQLAPWLSGLITYLRKQGAQLEIVTKKSWPRFLWRPLHKNAGGLSGLAKLWLRSKLGQVDHVFMWNGEDDSQQLLKKELAGAGVPCSILEVGYFPQKKYFTIDSHGINATSALIADDLTWIKQAHLEKLATHRMDYLAGRTWRGGGGFILVPLQLAKDTNIRHNSNFSDMQEFIRHCENKFQGQKIIFKKHPRDAETYSSTHEIICDGDFLDLAQRAELIYGINSTCLLESSLLGAPTQAIGGGFLKAHAHQQELLLAALVDKQVPIDCEELNYWMQSYAASETT